MVFAPFELERYFAQHEFVAPYLMCCSDIEPVKLAELVALADPLGQEWWANLSLGYTDYPGDLRLRQEIAKLYPGLRAEDIYCFAGAQEAIFCIFTALLEEAEQHVIVTWPGYQSLYEVARARGADVSLLELKDEEGWQFSEERLLALWKPNTRLVVVNFPHNPTGAVLSTEQQQRLVSICQERGARLFSDEVYHGLGPVDPAPAACLSPNAMSLGVMSKSFGLAGLRVGWLACRDSKLMRRIAVLKDYTTICNAAPSEALAYIGLRARETLWRRAREILNANLTLFCETVAEFPKMLEWVAPSSGTMAFPRWKGGAVGDFAEALRQETGVLILPGNVYGHSGNHFRVGLGRRNFPEVLARFRDFLKRADFLTSSAKRAL